MNLLIICSKVFYSLIPEIKYTLEAKGHKVLLPNCYDQPKTEMEMKKLGDKEHAKFKASMFKQSEKVISSVDAVLVLNLNKNGVSGYIGGATFLEMYDAFRLGKLIFLFNDISDNLLSDEIKGFSPIIINGDLTKVTLGK